MLLFQKKYFVAISILIILFVISSFFTISSFWNNKFNLYGIVYSEIIETRSEPNIFSKRLFVLHEGIKVRVKQKVDNWFEIELLDGKVGWVKEKMIRLIK